MRIILLIIAIVAVFMIVRILLRGRPRKTLTTQAEEAKQQGLMVPCAHCGVHVPHLEAFHAGEQLYCSREHAEAAARARDDD